MNRIITGNVRDINGQPLQGATVQAFSGQAPVATDPGKVTDEQGYYSLYIGEREKVRVTYVGMEPHEVTLLPDQIELYVQLVPVTLDEVTIAEDAPTPKAKPDYIKHFFWLLFIAIAIAAAYTIK